MIAELIQQIAQGKGAKFASFLYRNERGEIARYTIILGASTETLYHKDVLELGAMIPTLEGLALVAANELLTSRNNSLRPTETASNSIGHNPEYTLEDVYVYPMGLERVGIRVHKENGTIQVSALVQSKVVLVEGEAYGPDTRRPKTVAKDKIRKLLPSGRFRTFRIDRVGTSKMNGETLEIQNLDVDEPVTANV